MSSHSSPSYPSFEKHERFLRVWFSDSEFGDYHWFWLRHNCLCVPLCRHHFTNECLIDSSDFPLDISPASVSLHNHESNIEIVIDWNPQGDVSDTSNIACAPHKSVYSIEFLKENGYAMKTQEVAVIPSVVEQLEIDYRDYFKESGEPHSIEHSEAYLRSVGKKLASHGAVIVRHRGLDTEAIIEELLPEGGEVIPTHFGRIEDLKTDNKTNMNTDQLGYTDAAVNLHTDQPFIEKPPGMQMLQCIREADSGGENYMVDAFAAAEYLRMTDGAAFDMLTKTPVRFYRKQKSFSSLVVKPIFEINPITRRLLQVRYSYFTYAPHVHVSFDLMELWYQSYNKFAKLVRDRKNQYFFKLQSGDFVLYDNFRMFHARTAFSGARHMRGVYFSSEQVFKKLLKPAA